MDWFFGVLGFWFLWVLVRGVWDCVWGSWFFGDGVDFEDDWISRSML